jgi:hypothetical protein
MACPRCQIQTLGTRLCNHCFKTRRKTSAPVATSIVVDRKLSWRAPRKDNPTHHGFQTRNGIQAPRMDLSHPQLVEELPRFKSEPAKADPRMFRNPKIQAFSRRYLIGLGLLIFLLGQLISIGAFTTGHFGTWCAGNFLSISGVAFALFSACNIIGLLEQRVSRLTKTATEKASSPCTAPVSQECT